MSRRRPGRAGRALVAALVLGSLALFVDQGSVGHSWAGFIGSEPLTHVSGDLRVPSWHPQPVTAWYYGYVMATGGDAAHQWWVQVGYEPSGTWVEAKVTGAGGWQVDRGHGPLVPGSWHHFAVDYVGGDWWRTSVDGATLDTFNVPGSIAIGEVAFEVAQPVPTIPDVGFVNLAMGRWCGPTSPDPYVLVASVPCHQFYVRN